MRRPRRMPEPPAEEPEEHVFQLKDTPINIRNRDRLDENIQSVGLALEKYKDAHGGRIEPREILEEARNPKHFMHDHIQWDKDIAAENWQLQQVRWIINHVMIFGKLRKNDDEPKQYPAFLNFAVGRERRAYHFVHDVITNFSLENAAYEEIMRYLAAAKARAKPFENICKIVIEAHEKVAAMRPKPPEPPAPPH